VKERIFNFSAGPAVLPEPVLERAQEALWSLGDSGIGVCEHSHRGPEFDEVMLAAEANIRKLAGVPDDYDVLFLQGGASTQFFMVPMNFLGPDQTADYIHTGVWSKKAMAEARRFGKVHIAASSEDDDFSYIPREVTYSANPRYVHYTSNNTIFGTQFTDTPTAPGRAELVCDASSDIFAAPVDVAKHGMIYAGAQKNLGPAGLTLVILKKSLVEAGAEDLPTMLRYRTHAAEGSRFNTPPTFAIYVVGEVIKWLIDLGGLPAIAEHNRDKAKLLYDHLDDSAMFSPTARDGSRSLMNVTFRSTSPELDAKFISEATRAGMSGLKGHRSVGGMRASIYNAFPREGVARLVEFMKDFEQKNS